jgi:hypothetical protein
MENKSKQGNNIGSENQNGGITAQNVTINNYGPLSKGFGKFNFLFKNKAVKWPAFGIICVWLIFSIGSFKGKQISTKEEFYKFLLDYYQSIDKKSTDAHNYFTDNISIFYEKRNINPDSVNKIRKTSDYKDSSNNIDKDGITVRKGADGINYWRFKSGMTCYRPTKDKFQKCNVEMEFGLDSDNKIASIEQIRYWDLNFTDERPQL